MTSEYGKAFDRIAKTWATVEDGHDKIHPDRGDCGGVGGCMMMMAAVDLERDMMSALDKWRTHRRD